MEIPFIALILQGIPEEVSLVTLAFVIAKADLDWKKIISGGIFLSCSMFIARLLPISFGVHTIVLVLLLIIFVNKFGQIQNLSLAIMASLISILILITVETIFLTLLMHILGVSEPEFLTNLTMRVLLTLPQVLLMFIIAFIINKVRKNRGELVNL